ncbi:MAG: Hpt domain-containing protein [Defluviitaleaceae bacterium]|nr:Hpt domain-containing protein [Defluviitaleaceae bacterium]
MDYSAYLPDIDVEDGKARVMNNLKLYLRLLGKFDGAKMKNDIVRAVDEGDGTDIIQAAHALRGTAANLGFPIVQDVTKQIEALGKTGEDCHPLMDSLDKSMESLTGAIERLLAAQS